MLFIVAAVAITACAKNEEVYTGTQKEIGLFAYNQNVTRGAAFDGTTFPTERDMNVSALYHNEKSQAVKYFEDVTFTYTTDSWKAGWYYPLNGTIDFMAYSTDADVTATWSIDNAINSVELAFDTALDGKEDVMYSNLLSNVSCPQNNNQKLTFNHALAWLYFNVKAKSQAAADAIEINSITVNGVSLSGKATITAAATSSVAWTNPSTPADVVVPDFSAAQLTLDAQAVSNGLLVVPQNQTSFTINYTITNGSGENIVKHTMDYTFPLIGTDKWSDAKKYIYNINIDLHEITFTADVTDYEQSEEEKDIE